MSDSDSYRYVKYICLDDINHYYIELPLIVMSIVLLIICFILMLGAKQKIKVICYPKIVSEENNTYCVFSTLTLRWVTYLCILTISRIIINMSKILLGS